MKTYDVYRHPTQDSYEAVKHGFSWPAFLFSWIWALVKGLWVQAAAFIAVEVTLVHAQRVFQESGMPPGNPVVSLFWLALCVWFGRSGNEWRRRSLERRGYEHVRTVDAQIPFEAIEKVPSPGERGESA